MKPYSITRTKYLSDSERQTFETDMRSLLDQSSVSTSDKRYALAFLVLLHTGARASEVLQLRYVDMFTNTSSVFVRGLKGSLDREIPLPSWLFVHLESHTMSLPNERDKNVLPDIPSKQHNDFLFKMSYSSLYRVWQMVGVKGKKLHSLRHTFALSLYQRTRDINLVKHALGHVSISSTMVYQSYAYTSEELRKAIVQEASV